jgi:hypothetical protein
MRLALRRIHHWFTRLHVSRAGSNSIRFLHAVGLGGAAHLRFEIL